MPEVRAVITQELFDHVTARAKAAGLSNAKWIAYLVRQDMTSPSIAEVNSDRIMGANAEQILFRSEVRWLTTGEKVTWFDGWLWLVGKSANGYQTVLSRLMDYPQVLFNRLVRVYRPVSKVEVIQALENWNELKALDGIELVGDRWLDDGRAFFRGDQVYERFSCYKERVIKDIAEAKASLQEATAAVEPANEIDIEVAKEASSPLNAVVAIDLELTSDEVKLTAKEFRAKFGFVGNEGNETYGAACNAGRTDAGYLADDGSRWVVGGTKSKAVWTRHPVTSQIAEPRVLSIV